MVSVISPVFWFQELRSQFSCALRHRLKAGILRDKILLGMDQCLGLFVFCISVDLRFTLDHEFPEAPLFIGFVDELVEIVKGGLDAAHSKRLEEELKYQSPFATNFLRASGRRKLIFKHACR